VKKAVSPTESSVNRRRRRRRAVQYALVFVGCVLVIDAFVGDNGLLEMMKKRAEYRGLEDTLSKARADNAALREEARRLREDPRAIEELARRELGLIKPGEKLFIIKDLDPADTSRRK
jgi:cell division protein FtsB